MMQSDDARYLKRKVKSGAIDVHPTEKALIVNYELEAVILGEQGDMMHGDKKECQRIIRLKNLNAKTDCAALAKDVIEKCTLIHPSKIDEVEQLIYYLKTRKGTPQSASLTRPQTSSSALSTTSVSLSNLEEYVELLYEDIPQKIKGSMLILEIAKNQDNLLELSKNEPAISALTRVLREDWRKSLDLSTNIACILFYFSTYSDFHPVIVQYKIGSLCMFILEQELQRYDEWENELIHNIPPPEKEQTSPPATNGSSETRKSKIPEPTRRPRSGLWTLNEATLIRPKTAMSTNVRDNNVEDFASEMKTRQNNLAPNKKQLSILMKKQDNLIRVLFYLLLNIAEDLRIEEKMARKNIVEMLIRTLHRDNMELLTLVVTFLKKLSLQIENIDEMARLDVVKKILPLLAIPDAELVHVSLKLLFNLSFSYHFRVRMISLEILPELVRLLRDDKHQNIILKLLYHLSYEKEVRPLFTQDDCVELLTDMVLLNREPMVDEVLIALCINLARDEDNAEYLLDKNAIPELMKRALRYKDPMLMKMLRNLAKHTFVKDSFLEFVAEVLRLAVQEELNSFFSLECIGLVGHMNLPEIDYYELFTRLEVVPWIRKTFSADFVEDDYILEIILVIGTASLDEKCAKFICDEKLVPLLIEMLNAKQVDDEIVLQIIYIFYQVLAHDSTRIFVINESDAIAYLIDLLRDKNQTIRKWCNYCLDLIALTNEEWASRIKIEKFRAHNAEWLDMMENHDLNSMAFEELGDELPAICDQFDEDEESPTGQRIALDLGLFDSNKTAHPQLHAMQKSHIPYNIREQGESLIMTDSS